MMWFFAILIVLALGGVAAVAAGRGAPLSEAYVDLPDALVPAEGPLTARHLGSLRFSVVFRGYRMSEVDALLDRLAQQLGDPPVSEPVAEVPLSDPAPGARDPLSGNA